MPFLSQQFEKLLFPRTRKKAPNLLDGFNWKFVKNEFYRERIIGVNQETHFLRAFPTLVLLLLNGLPKFLDTYLNSRATS